MLVLLPSSLSPVPSYLLCGCELRLLDAIWLTILGGVELYTVIARASIWPVSARSSRARLLRLLLLRSRCCDVSLSIFCRFEITRRSIASILAVIQG